MHSTRMSEYLWASRELVESIDHKRNRPVQSAWLLYSDDRNSCVMQLKGGKNVFAQNRLNEGQEI